MLQYVAMSQNAASRVEVHVSEWGVQESNWINTLQHTASTLQHMQHTATHCNNKVMDISVRIVQGRENAQDAWSCWPLSAKEPLITGLFCAKWPMKMRDPMLLWYLVLTTRCSTPMGHGTLRNESYHGDTWRDGVRGTLLTHCVRDAYMSHSYHAYAQKRNGNKCYQFVFTL